MSKKLANSTEQYLKSYSALVDYWEEDAGDTHQILDLRELLSGLQKSMNNDEIGLLNAIDNAVLNLSAKIYDRETWDVAMLRKTADVIRSYRPVRHAA